jgi:hypothetical protein
MIFNAMNAARHLKCSFAFLKQIVFLFVQNAKAKIPGKKFPRWPLLYHPLLLVQSVQPAIVVADHRDVLPDQANH